MSPYANFDEKQTAWFWAIIEGMVSDQEYANFARIRRGMDLEIMIRVRPKDVHIFTPEVCMSLAQLLGVVTGTTPVVYLEGAPHQAAQEAIYATLNNC
ncbi:MAG: hypothetical protein A2493_01640 [Candidatus Magasanikbacteria bacterium RIFOXYC12_FULL_33_11]|uniref:Uncharacterized protein n=1 Tax=Candidatus Magasanikbacteria bacterium RIFOXYC12_FULL_33_11 TaxID=1798701 RepID=A0A1F6NLU8_9BACT|nr:MAG: hypothetical protein A2493_01640 [Candidatus Magasanikbacteria bacterium RIFOXYC12_FULL_33_11]